MTLTHDYGIAIKPTWLINLGNCSIVHRLLALPSATVIKDIWSEYLRLASKNINLGFSARGSIAEVIELVTLLRKHPVTKQLHFIGVVKPHQKLLTLDSSTCSSWRSSKNHLLLIQCHYRWKPKLNWLYLHWIALLVLKCSSQRSSKDHLLLIQCY